MGELQGAGVSWWVGAGVGLGLALGVPTTLFPQCLTAPICWTKQRPPRGWTKQGPVGKRVHPPLRNSSENKPPALWAPRGQKPQHGACRTPQPTAYCPCLCPAALRPGLP